MAPSVADLPLDDLTTDEKLALLARLWDSLLAAGPPPVPDWHRDEVRRRLASTDDRHVASIPLDQLRRELSGDRP